MIEIPSELRKEIIMGVRTVEHEGVLVDIPPAAKQLSREAQNRIRWIWQRDGVTYTDIVHALGFKHMIKMTTRNGRNIIKEIDVSKLSKVKLGVASKRKPKQDVEEREIDGRKVKVCRVPNKHCERCWARSGKHCMLVGCAKLEGWG